MGLALAYLVLAFTDRDTIGSPWALKLWRRPLIAAVGILFYWSCLTWFGFPATTFIFLLYWLWILERESWRRIALVSVSATAGLYVVFTLILRIRLPMGTLF
jgi:cytochrome oxidase assembly protein ShyY1